MAIGKGNQHHAPQPSGIDTAAEFAERTRVGFSAKADHNKRESLNCFILIIFTTATIPLFVTLGEGLWLAKVLPSILSVSAGIATTWLQLRRPQQLWGLYRGAQRELEDQQTKHRFRIGEYETAVDPDKLLAQRVADIALDAHQSWTAVIPNPEHLQALERGRVLDVGARRNSA